MTQPKCPYCLGTHPFGQSNRCDVTGWDIPVEYLRKYNAMKPLWLMAVGFSKHGKSSQLSAMALVLENIGRAWPRTAVMALDQFTRDAISDMRLQAVRNQDVPKTPVDYPRPMLFHSFKIPEKEDSCLILYDTPGELFEKIEESKKATYLNFLKQIKTIWLIVSLPDLGEENQSHRQIDDLLNYYLQKMNDMGASPKDRNLVVVYTKADKLFPNGANPFDLPGDIDAYIHSDPLMNINIKKSPMGDVQAPVALPSFSEYIAGMRKVSDTLLDFTRTNVAGGVGFVNIAEYSGMHLYFTVCSAQGGDTWDTNVPRYRVLDPFFWALELNSFDHDPVVKVVIDAGYSSDGLYANRELMRSLQAIPDMAEMTTFFLGQKAVASRPDQLPPSAPPRNRRARLIGPILDNVTANVPVIVFTSGPIPDLEDFKSSWGERCMLISVGEDYVQDWPTSVVFRSADKADFLINEIKNFINNFS
jgi:hypothetical protein